MVYRNNASRLGVVFISVSSETRWLGQNRGFYESEPPCILVTKNRSNQTSGDRVTRDVAVSQGPNALYYRDCATFFEQMGMLVKIIVCTESPHVELFRTTRIATVWDRGSELHAIPTPGGNVHENHDDKTRWIAVADTDQKMGRYSMFSENP